MRPLDLHVANVSGDMALVTRRPVTSWPSECSRHSPEQRFQLQIARHLAEPLQHEHPVGRDTFTVPRWNGLAFRQADPGCAAGCHRVHGGCRAGERNGPVVAAVVKVDRHLRRPVVNAAVPTQRCLMNQACASSCRGRHAGHKVRLVSSKELPPRFRGGPRQGLTWSLR